MFHSEENWHVIHSHPEYAVSDHGRVLNLKKDRFLTISAGRRGGTKVILYKNNIQTVFQVNRLVASIFMRDYDYTKEILNLDGDKKNNHILNLGLGKRVSRSRFD